MKKRTRASSIPSLRKDASDEEVIRWTTTHDVFDRLEAGVAEIVEDHSDLEQLLQEAVVQGNTAQLKMRIPPAMKAVLSRLARQRTTDATTLARIWLAERLQKELKAQ
ncbi:MAG: hypothetical protein AB7P69_14685 [Candidatus Binatia bacterium]